MSKPSKNTLRSPLKERGVDGAIRSRYAEDKMIVDFHFTDSTILPDSSISVMNCRMSDSSNIGISNESGHSRFLFNRYRK